MTEEEDEVLLPLGRNSQEEFEEVVVDDSDEDLVELADVERDRLHDEEHLVRHVSDEEADEAQARWYKDVPGLEEFMELSDEERRAIARRVDLNRRERLVLWWRTSIHERGIFRTVTIPALVAVVIVVGGATMMLSAGGTSDEPGTPSVVNPTLAAEQQAEVRQQRLERQRVAARKRAREEARRQARIRAKKKRAAASARRKAESRQDAAETPYVSVPVSPEPSYTPTYTPPPASAPAPTPAPAPAPTPATPSEVQEVISPIP